MDWHKIDKTVVAHITHSDPSQLFEMIIKDNDRLQKKKAEDIKKELEEKENLKAKGLYPNNPIPVSIFN